MIISEMAQIQKSVKNINSPTMFVFFPSIQWVELLEHSVKEPVESSNRTQRDAKGLPSSDIWTLLSETDTSEGS
jgi:hypothetical protein